MLFGAILAASLANPALVAVNRCNNYVATSLEDQVRAYDRRPPGEKDRNDRFVALQGVTASVNEEAGILHAVCSESDFLPIAAQLQAVQAWTLLLESDLDRANYAAKCPAAELPVARAVIANAWLLAVKTDPSSSGRYPSLANVIPKIGSRATAAGLVLPAADQTSAYWLTQQQAAANEAVKSCGE